MAVNILWSQILNQWVILSTGWYHLYYRNDAHLFRKGVKRPQVGVLHFLFAFLWAIRPPCRLLSKESHNRTQVSCLHYTSEAQIHHLNMAVMTYTYTNKISNTSRALRQRLCFQAKTTNWTSHNPQPDYIHNLPYSQYWWYNLHDLIIVLVVTFTV